MNSSPPNDEPPDARANRPTSSMSRFSSRRGTSNRRVSPSRCVVKRPTRVWALFVTTFAYGLTPASESAFAILSARSSAADFFGTGAVDLLRMKQPCVPMSRAASVRGFLNFVRNVVSRRLRWRGILFFLEHAYRHAHRVIPLVHINGGARNAACEWAA